ncbi:MAG: flagellar type III secretion system protein FlhB [Pseudomonadota bacterium]
MSGQPDEDTEKPFEATPEKLRKAREKGDIARAPDLLVAASYAGLFLTALIWGETTIRAFGSHMMAVLDQSDRLAPLMFGGGAPQAVMGPILLGTAQSLLPWFLAPAAFVLILLAAQRGIVFAPSKIQPKLSRISIISNAKNKFGRTGLFEFAKSFTKLCFYSLCLALFLRARLPDIAVSSDADPGFAVALMGRLFVELLLLVLLIATAIGGIDALWQYHEHQRKNRMSRKEIMDETKDAEGDPHFKQERRQRGQEIAMNTMIAEVPKADVVIVNPTHYAVALQWSRLPGTAPVCVAKGVDEVAAAIRKAASDADVPIHSDPPTARAVFATVDIGKEIDEEHYQAVAAAIRFADEMRRKMKGRVQ